MSTNWRGATLTLTRPAHSGDSSVNHSFRDSIPQSCIKFRNGIFKKETIMGYCCSAAKITEPRNRDTSKLPTTKYYLFSAEEAGWVQREEIRRRRRNLYRNCRCNTRLLFFLGTSLVSPSDFVAHSLLLQTHVAVVSGSPSIVPNHCFFFVFFSQERGRETKSLFGELSFPRHSTTTFDPLVCLFRSRPDRPTHRFLIANVTSRGEREREREKVSATILKRIFYWISNKACSL